MTYTPLPLQPTEAEAEFSVGQVVHHRLFGYRGVIIDADAFFQGSESWYGTIAKSKPPKDRPWYHVLVDGGQHQTYVAERNLEEDTEGGAIQHPNVAEYFQAFTNGSYIPRAALN